MEAVIYTRVSKLADNTSTADQEKECRAWCSRAGHDVRAVFTDDGISASRFSTKERPAWIALKSEIRKGDILVVWEASRANRDLEEFVALRNLCAELNVPLSYAGRVLDLTRGDDRFTGGLDALIAERESAQLKVRILRGKRASAAAGTPQTRPPWGYRLVRPREWEFDPVEAPRVREAVGRFLNGESQYSILQWLTDTPGYTPSSPTNLRRAVSNPTIAGLRVHHGEVVGKAIWPGIITEDQHHTLVALLKRKSLTNGWASPPGPEPIHLLTGIAICATCREPLRWKNWPRRSPAYICRRGHLSRVAYLLDQEIEKAVFDRLSMVDPNEFETGDDPEVEAAIKEMEEIKATLGEYISLAQTGEVSPSAFVKIEKGLNDRLAALRPKTLGKPRMEPMDIKDLESNWSTVLTMRERRDIIRKLFNITVVPSGRRGARNGSVIIEQL